MAKIPHKPIVADPVFQKWINHVHRLLETTPERQIAPPGMPGGLRVTPGPGMNRVTFIGGRGAESHLILASPNPTWDPTKPENHIFDIGRSTEFPHPIGIAAQKMNYWVIAVRDGLKTDPPVGPVSATTLALNVSLTPSPIVRQSPGNVVKSGSTQLPTVTLPGLTRGGREP